MDDKEWLISRKQFVKTIVLSGVALQLPWLNSCSNDEEIGETKPLSKDQYKTVRSVQDILFPADGNGPSARDIHATDYLIWVLNDKRVDPEENAYIIEKLNDFIAKCKSVHGNDFFDLYQSTQEEFIATISSESWGEKWLSRLLTLIFEALLLDPSYGGNVDEVGWNWLSHDPGQPRPTKEIMYPEILDRL